MIEVQQKIRTNILLNVTDNNRRFDFDLFNVSVTQKLWSTEEYYKDLVRLDINDFQEPPYVLEKKSDDLAESKTQSVSTMTSQPRPVNTLGYCRHLNRLIDGFFMNSMRSLDTLAHQIAILYTFPKLPNDIYIGSIKKKLLQYHSNSKIAKLLNEKLGQTWFNDFSSFRHCTAHESLIMYDIKLSDDQLNYCYKQPEIILPDEPKIRPFSYKKRRGRNATVYCQSVLKHIELLISKAYER